MRNLRAVFTIILIFLLAPLAADYFAAPGQAWGIGLLGIACESWVLLFRKTPKDIAEEQARLAEARRRVEQIKHEAAMSYLLPAPKAGGGASSKLDVDKMSPHELANAARQIVQDIRSKKEDGTGAAEAKAA